MVTKVIDFIFLEGRQEVRKRLAEVEFGTEPRCTLNPHGDLDLGSLESYFQRKQYYHSIEDLVKVYIHGTRFMNNFLRDIPSVGAPYLEPKTGYTFLTTVPFAFAPPNVVKKKLGSECAGLYSKEVGIFVSADLFDNNLCGTIVHEYAHYIHDSLFPLSFNKSEVMDEVMAIFSEENFGHEWDYVTSPHRKAKEILRRLREVPDFTQMNRGKQWDFLAEFKSYRKLQTYIAKNKNTLIPSGGFTEVMKVRESVSPPLKGEA